MNSFQSSVCSHQADFDRQYDKANLDTSHIKFPLEEIDKFEWERGPYGNEIYSYFYRRFTAHTIGLLQVEDGHRVLNVGCGAGSEEKNLINLYNKLGLVSTDISNHMIRTAIKNNSPSEFVISIGEQLPFHDETFDRVVAREVIEHVMSPAMMLKEIARCLKVGGVAVITTEFEGSLAPCHLYSKIQSKVLAPIFGVKLPCAPYKNEAPTVKTIKSLVASSGLVLERIVWDGAMYQISSSVLFQKVFKARIDSVARFFARLENEGSVDRFFCDQIKFVVRRREESVASSNKVTVMNASIEKTDMRCEGEYRSGRIGPCLFRYTDRMLALIFNSVVVFFAVVLAFYRNFSRKNSLGATLDDNLTKYLS